MTLSDLWLVLVATGLVLVAGVLSAVEASLSTFSRARADELVAEGRDRARRIQQVLDDPARYLNALLFVRLLCEVAAIVVATFVVLRVMAGDTVGFTVGDEWPALLVAVLTMLVVSFVVIGVGPRTLGRQHSQGVALASAGPVVLLTRVLGPLPRLLILVGNALTPGRGFEEGPFASEAELREMVDLAEASSLIESGERQMIHGVFELGDTLVREVMVPRPDIVYIERHKTLRQAMSLALRSGYSRLPVIDDNLDEIVGFAYLKDLAKRVFDNRDAEGTERVESMMRPVMHVPDSKEVDDLLREMQAERRHVAVVVDEYGGTAGIVTIEDILEEIVGEITDEHDRDEVYCEQLPNGKTRVSARYPIDDLDEAVGIDVYEEDVDTVGGLMGKHLGRVPIPGSVVEVHGLRFEAEKVTGRRNRIGTVLISRLEDSSYDSEADAAYPESHAG